jgi:hypothetical protein
MFPVVNCSITFQEENMKIDIDYVMACAQDGEGVGFCLSCGADQYGVEPDARGYECEECGKERVYGAEEILLMYAGA